MVCLLNFTMSFGLQSVNYWLNDLMWLMKEKKCPTRKDKVLSHIEKTGKDRTYLENWRPISLTNVHAKIASKVIATRIVKILPEIIHSNQTGCFWPIHRGGS